MSSIKAVIPRAVEHWARVSPKWLDAVAQAKDASLWWPTSGWRSHELAQAIFMESDAAPVFVGKCHDCVCGVVERIYTNTMEPWYDSDLLTRKDFKTKLTAAGLLATWTCPACDTGEKRAPVAVLLSDVANGDAAAREALLVHADELQAAGNPLGELLNWTLLLWMREPADLSHVDEAVRWLEWLTAQHELMRNRSASNYIVTVDGHEYRVTAHDSMTASEIAAALNEQGGPATFSANDDYVITTIRNGATSSTVIVSGNVHEADLLPPPQVPDEPSHQQHATHIGSRLGRRLGVRR